MLAYLLNIAARLYKLNLGRLSVYFAPLLVQGFAIFEEFTQMAFPSRSFDWNDMLFDVLGIAFFTLLSRVSYRKLSEII